MSNAIGYEWMNYEGKDRRNSYVAFIKDQPKRANLFIETDARAHRILWDEGPRAVGIRYEQAGALRSATATREVVLCAGALETPKLLMLSGIGPATRLQAAGVSVVMNAPEIGQNLQDHPNVTLFYRGDAEVDSFYPQLYSFGRANPHTSLPTQQSDVCIVYWPARSAMKEAAQRMLPGKVLPPALFDTKAKGMLRSVVGAAMSTGPMERMIEKLFGMVVILGKPKSRGELYIESSDPRAQAFIDPGYFTHPEDMETMLHGIRWASRIGKAEPLLARGAKPLMPSTKAYEASDDRALIRFVEKNVMTTFHFAGTCRMGEDNLAPVDTQLRLRGVEGLRIADASVTPVTPVSAMNAPSMLIGYRAAKMIRASARERQAAE